MQKSAIFALIKAAQGFAVRRTPVRRSRKSAENAGRAKRAIYGWKLIDIFQISP
jgi:hypothetical protein